MTTPEEQYVYTCRTQNFHITFIYLRFRHSERGIRCGVFVAGAARGSTLLSRVTAAVRINWQGIQTMRLAATTIAFI